MWPEDSSSGLEPADKGEPSAGGSTDSGDRNPADMGQEESVPGPTEGPGREGEEETVSSV